MGLACAVIRPTIAHQRHALDRTRLYVNGCPQQALHHAWNVNNPDDHVPMQKVACQISEESEAHKRQP